MKHRSTRWFLLGVGIAVTAGMAGIAGWVVAATRRYRPETEENIGAVAPEPARRLQPVH